MIPASLYFVGFALLTFPAILSFSTRFFGDGGDGLEDVWNLWSFNRSLTETHTSPWVTDLLFHPGGTSLVGQTMTPFNGVLAVLLLPFFSLAQVFNLLFIGAFVFTGVSAFWLSHWVTKDYWPSLLAGAAFTFCNYHFAHGQGHLNLITLQWVPVFLLSALLLLSTAKKRWAILAAVALFLVQMSSLYYFAYMILAGILIVAWARWARRDGWPVRTRIMLWRGLLFSGVSLLLCGPLVGAVYWLQRTDPLVGWHVPRDYGMDLLAPFVYGGHWRFSEWTRGYWENLPGTIHESSVHVGWGVLLLATASLWRREDDARRWRWLFLALVTIFFVLAVGPLLFVGGELVAEWLPYSVLTWLLPFLRMATVPVRFIIISQLGLVVLAAFGARHLHSQGRKGQAALAVLLALMVCEILPRPLPLTSLEVPDYVRALRALPRGAVIDTVAGPQRAMYYQTVHEQPMYSGHIARRPRSVVRSVRRQTRALRARNATGLADRYRFRYVVARSRQAKQWNRPVVFEGDGVVILDLM